MWNWQDWLFAQKFKTFCIILSAFFQSVLLKALCHCFGLVLFVCLFELNPALLSFVCVHVKEVSRVFDLIADPAGGGEELWKQQDCQQAVFLQHTRAVPAQLVCASQ